MGYHPYDDELLKDEDLPWAQVLMPPVIVDSHIEQRQ